MVVPTSPNALAIVACGDHHTPDATLDRIEFFFDRALYK
jgi:hypothetical protein